jgi:hypothetical protein
VLIEDEFFDADEYVCTDEHVNDLIDSIHHLVVSNTYVEQLQTQAHRLDFDALRPFFGWASAETIKQTFAVTTQYACGRVSETIKEHWKSWFLGCNVK